MSEKRIIERENDSGSVSWTDSIIEWQNPNGPDVTINLCDVVAIGEYTTDAGPFFDDWFLVFVYKTGDWDVYLFMQMKWIRLSSTYPDYTLLICLPFSWQILQNGDHL